MMTTYLICALIGAVAGLMSGLLGIGGGIIIVPALTFLLTRMGVAASEVIHYAVGTSLATIIFSSASAAFYQHKRGSVAWNLLHYIAPGSIVGALLGGAIAPYFPSYVLSKGFGVFCVWLALVFLKPQEVLHSPPTGHAIPRHQFMVMGVLVGLVSSMLGIGGGVILIPWLVRRHFSLQQAGALSVTSGLPTMVIGSLTAILFGWDVSDGEAMGLKTFGYVIWPFVLIQGFSSLITAKWGVHLTHTLPKHWLRRIFAVVLLGIAWRMLT